MSDIGSILTNNLRAARELTVSPGLAVATTAGTDPVAMAQATAQAANFHAQDQALGNVAQATGTHPNLLHQSLGWLGGAAHTVNQATGGVIGDTINALGGPLREVQHQYRYLHDVEARHGPIPALLEGLGIAGGALAAGYFSGGNLQAAALGGEAVAKAESALFYKDSYDRTSSGSQYQGGYNRQTNTYAAQGPAGTVTFGRDISGILGLKKGSKPATWTSGLLDAVGDLATDPVQLGLGVSHAATAGEGIGREGSALAARFPSIELSAVRTPEEVDAAYNAHRGVQRAVAQLANATRDELTSNKQWAPWADELAEATTPQQVLDVIKDHVDVARTNPNTYLPEKLPTSTMVGGLARKFSQAVQEYGSEIDPATGQVVQGSAPTNALARGITKLTNFVPSNFDPKTMKLSRTEFEYGNDHGIHTVFQVARESMSERAAQMEAGIYAATKDEGERRAIYRNVLVRMFAAKGMEEDAPYVSQELDRMIGGAKEGAHGLFGTSGVGRDLSVLPATEDKVASAAAITENQIGKASIPDFMQVNAAARQLDGWKAMYGNADDFIYKQFTQNIFKRTALLTGGFALRIVAAEGIPTLLREGVIPIVKARLATTGAELGLMGDDPNLLGRIVGKLGDGIDRFRGVTPTAEDVAGPTAGVPATRQARIAVNSVLGNKTNVEDLTDMLLSSGTNGIPSAVTSGEHYSSEVGAAVRAERDVKMAGMSLPPGKMAGDTFGHLGPADAHFDQAWAQKLSTVSNSEASQAAADGYLATLRAAQRGELVPEAPVTVGAPPAATVPTTAADIPPAELYHGTSKPFKEGQLEHRYFVGAGASNYFGPGVYTTDNPEVALSYTGKGATPPLTVAQLHAEMTGAEVPVTGKTVYGMKTNKAMNFIDLEQPLPDDAKAIFQRHITESLGAGHADFAQETADHLAELMRSPDATGAEVYQQIRKAYSEAELPKYEVDEALNDLHDELQTAGYDGFRYEGGKRAGRGKGVTHNAYVVFEPSNLEITHTTAAGERPVGAAAGETEAPAAAAPAAGAIGPGEGAAPSRAVQNAKDRADRWREAVRQLDERGAPDREYAHLLSTGSKKTLKKGETWRDEVLKFADHSDEQATRFAAEDAAAGGAATPTAAAPAAAPVAIAPGPPITDLDTITRLASEAGAKAATAQLKTMGESRLSLYERYHRSSVPGVDPMDDWGRVVMENVRNATHSPDIEDEAGNIIRRGTPHLDLLQNVSEGTQTDLGRLMGMETEMKPAMIEARQLIDIPHQNVLERVSNFGFSRVIEPIINSLSREPMYANEWLKQYQPLKQWVEDGTMAKADALQYAHVRASENIVPFIHNVHERSQFAELAHNYMPFFFAQQQALARYGRILADDPSAFRQLQLMTQGLKDTASSTKDANGNSWMVYPGLGFLTQATTKALGNLGIPIAGSVPVSYSGRVASLGSVFPLSDVAPKFGPVVSIAGHLLENLHPELRPVVTKVVGDAGNQGSIWAQLIPSTPVRSLVQAFGDPDRRSFASASMQTIQSLAFQQEQAMAKWDAGGQVGPKPDIAPDADAGPLAQQKFVDRVRNQTRILFMMKAIIGAATPTAVTPNIGDLGLSAELRDAIKAQGLTAGTDAFLKAHPDATPYTVAQSASAVGAPIPATVAAEDFMNAHEATLAKYPYAAAWLVPQPTNAEFDQGIYNEQLAQGRRVKKGPSQMLNDLYIAAGNNDFYGRDQPAYQAALAAAVAAGDADRATQLRSAFNDYITTYGKANPIWWSDFTSPTRAHDRQLAADQLMEMKTKGALVGPQAADLSSLLDDYQRYQQAQVVGRADSFAETSAKQLKENWQNYVADLSNQKPNLRPVINKVFRNI